MNEIEITWLSIVPSILTITLAFITRQVIISLFAGVISGSIVYFLQTGEISNLNLINSFLLPSVGTRSFASLLIIYLWCLGGILGIWRKTGSAVHFAKLVGKKFAKGPKRSMIFTWVLGMIFHQGATISTILTGSTSKPISDDNKISHEELSYIVDSTAAPGATLIPFNAWPMYVSGLVLGTIPLLETPIVSYKFYLSCIPFNFYAVFAIALTGLFSLNLLPWIGKKMKLARIRARTTNQLDADNSRPLLNYYNAPHIPDYFKPSIYEFLLPVLCLLSITITPFICWRCGVIEIENANCINEAFMIAVTSAICVAKIRGMHFVDIMEGFIDGCKDMTIGAIIFALALSLATVTKKLQTADYLINTLSNDLSVIYLPICVMALCMITAFSTGSAFGTYAVVFPIALPLAYAVYPDIFFIKICFGAILGGAVFGDQCSPISDTTIFASMFSGCDLMDHVKTQLPLAMVAAVLGGTLSTLLLVFR